MVSVIGGEPGLLSMIFYNFYKLKVMVDINGLMIHLCREMGGLSGNTK